MARQALVLIVLALGLLLNGPLTAWADTFKVTDIRIEGLQRISAGTVFSLLPVKIGDSTTDEVTAKSIRSLYASGFFEDVKVERDGTVLVVTVQERPAVSEIILTGYKDIDEEALRAALKEIGLAEGRVFNKSILDRIEQELKNQYFSRGKYGIEIQTTVSPLDRNRVRVTIDIIEGLTARIKQINVIGNEAFPEKELLGLFKLGKSDWASWYSKNDQYSKQKLGGDLETLRSFYLDRGFIKFEIKSTQVSISADRKEIYITVVINEGDIFMVSDIQLAGQPTLPVEEVFPLIHMRRGEPFSRKATTQSAERVSRRLADEGYAFANVNTIPEINDEKKEVKVIFFVDPGKRVYVRRVNMKGNTRTRDEVLRREMRQLEAAWFSSELVKESRERLQRLGFFDEVNIETPAVPGSPDQVDVDVTVKEKPSGNLMAGVGYSQTQGILFNT
ncbi:MAG: outer membrane protein assembly factor BamA, partial [Chromatiaceae bacterium]|nr:outer membrane protein assembly factor BamA [Chromatiaceae bacterium]